MCETQTIVVHPFPCNRTVAPRVFGCMEMDVVEVLFMSLFPLRSSKSPPRLFKISGLQRD